MRVQVVDPSAFTRPYDHALCTALALAGARVELVTSRFAFGQAPAPDGYVLRDHFYRHANGAAASRRRLALKLMEHVPDMLRYRRLAKEAEVVHFQWLPVQPIDVHLLPRRPLVLTAHDLLPREPRPGQLRAQRRLYERVDAVVVHSQHGRSSLVNELGVDERKVSVIPHGAFEYLLRADRAPLPGPLPASGAPVVLFFGLLRPYKGLEVLLAAWREVRDAELWIVGRPRMAIDELVRGAPSSVRFVPRFVTDGELATLFDRADVVVLPYTATDRFDQSGVLATALAFGNPLVLSDVGGFGELTQTGSALVVPPGDTERLRDAMQRLIDEPSLRTRLSKAAREAAAGPYSWDRAASRTIELYRRLIEA